MPSQARATDGRLQVIVPDEKFSMVGLFGLNREGRDGLAQATKLVQTLVHLAFRLAGRPRLTLCRAMRALGGAIEVAATAWAANRPRFRGLKTSKQNRTTCCLSLNLLAAKNPTSCESVGNSR